MKVMLTKGMGGKEIEQISDEANVNLALESFRKWKESHKGQYKIESYDRLIFSKDTGKIIIDFGDYFYFITIEVGTDNWSEVNNIFKI